MTISISEVAKNNTAKSCWMIINQKVYDVTSFVPQHPGGQKVILQYAGKDATNAFEAIHPPNFLVEHLTEEQHLGDIDQSSSIQHQASKKTKDQERVELERKRRPHLSRMLNADDLENVAMKVLPYKARAYFMSGADDETTARESKLAYTRFFFVPRVLRAVSQCDPSTTILGYSSSLPLYMSYAGLQKLADPGGDTNLTDTASRIGLIQMVGTHPSLPHSQIASHAASLSPPPTLFFQMYKNPSTEIAEKLVRQIDELGYKAIFLTVDAPVLGRRERDERATFEVEDMDREGEYEYQEEGEEEEEGDGGVAATYAKQDDPDKTWEETIPWLRGITSLPIVLKGIQSVEDALLAVNAGVDGIVISNHGGRQLNYAPPPIEVLYKLRTRQPELFDPQRKQKFEVYIDGGIRRGTDILKALCLGARAVGIGRPFSYANAAYGTAGCIKLARIFEREIITGMRLLGARGVGDLVPEMVERVDWAVAKL